jgi:hypothetical protein
MIRYNIVVYVSIALSVKGKLNHPNPSGGPLVIKRKLYAIDVDLRQNTPHNY